jgi:hypothetical protein
MVWDLHVTQPMDLTYVGIRPYISFRDYPLRVTVLMGSEYGRSDWFYITVGSEEYKVNISDFKEISFLGKLPSSASPSSTVEVTVSNGQRTVGLFNVGREARRAGPMWYLVMNLRNSDRFIAIHSGVVAMLSRRPE